MIRLSVIGCIEMGAVESDPMEITITTTSPNGLSGGGGTFEVPARFVGTVFGTGRPARIVLQDGQCITLSVTGFDMTRGLAHFEAEGPLPIAQARRA